MDNTYIAFDKLKKLYPDEWVLLGNPEMKNTSVLGGMYYTIARTKKKFAILVEIKLQITQLLP